VPFPSGQASSEGNTELHAGLGHAYALSGDRVEANKVLEQLNSLSKYRYVAPYNVTVIYAGLGETDKAFDWLNRAYDDRAQPGDGRNVRL
jgi:Flp pilus assembly protein TadD